MLQNVAKCCKCWKKVASEFCHNVAKVGRNVAEFCHNVANVANVANVKSTIPWIFGLERVVWGSLKQRISGKHLHPSSFALRPTRNEGCWILPQGFGVFATLDCIGCSTALTLAWFGPLCWGPCPFQVAARSSFHKRTVTCCLKGFPKGSVVVPQFKVGWYFGSQEVGGKKPFVGAGCQWTSSGLDQSSQYFWESEKGIVLLLLHPFPCCSKEY